MYEYDDDDDDGEEDSEVLPSLDGDDEYDGYCVALKGSRHIHPTQHPARRLTPHMSQHLAIGKRDTPSINTHIHTHTGTCTYIKRYAGSKPPQAK